MEGPEKSDSVLHGIYLKGGHYSFLKECRYFLELGWRG
jgi:hypothetical protein